MEWLLVLESMGKVPVGATNGVVENGSAVGSPSAGRLFERRFEVAGKELIIKQDFAGDVGKSEVWRAVSTPHMSGYVLIVYARV